MAKEIVLQNAIGEDLYPHTSAECVEDFDVATQEILESFTYSRDDVDTMLADYVKHRTPIGDDYKEIDIEQYF